MLGVVLGCKALQQQQQQQQQQEQEQLPHMALDQHSVRQQTLLVSLGGSTLPMTY
jgi:hypothetical protein